MKRSTSHNSKLSSAGYNPSGSSFTSANSDKLRSKKKSWINNALNPTYTSRCEDFRRNFPTLPADEMLLGDYSCALQKDILVHGRIFVTINFLCFYANIFKWETAVTIRWKEKYSPSGIDLDTIPHEQQ
ncbi:GRAM domain-containing protein 1B [Eurytemora carolleeae]|uniref:GRAM domain-containing protein 1B n=1 Tax=Eurytemora carolleeae TaxID=1294199 RepID=UPI000C78E8C1|nr:GRAM domain-containing protein 1B [Eurytemora carolleeae]|eukprot:XP_023336595.1 GRAM domain-containing protein 1B-like [Eurytemora affinis]